MAKISVQMRGGEQDGWEQNDWEVTNGRRPDMIFMWPALETSRVNSARGGARSTLIASIGTLAYKFFDTVECPEKPGGLVYRYVRYTKADKKGKTANA